MHWRYCSLPLSHSCNHMLLQTALVWQSPFQCFHMRMLMIYCFNRINLISTEFTVSPKSTALLLGSDLSLDCVAVDVPFNRPITYQWEFQNESIHSNIPHAFIFTNSSLFISRITQNELGTYTCVAQVSGDLTSAERSEDATIVKACEFLENCEFVKPFTVL